MKRAIYLLSVVLTVMVLVMVYAFQSPSSSPQEKVSWYQVTVIESVVPGGIGRSRMISQDENGKMDEVKLENFFSLTGINFGNVRENDQQITNKITELTNNGWHLYNVTSGVYGGNNNNNQGIFITRYLYSKTEPSEE